MRRLTVTLSMASVLWLAAVAALAQDEKKADTPSGKAPASDPRQMVKQLEDVVKALHPAEQAAIDADPALQAERQAIMDEIQQTMDKIEAFERKVDEKVLATSPESKQLVDEKRDLTAKIESAAPGSKKGGMAMARLMRFLWGGVFAGREKGDRPAKAGRRGAEK